MTDTQDALAQIANIARRHNLSARDIAQALKPVAQEEKTEKSESVTARVLSYLGAILILAGVYTYTGMFWSTLNSVSRIIITLGSGIVFHVLAVIAAGDPRLLRAIKPLRVLSILLLIIGGAVTCQEVSSHWNELNSAARIIVTFGTGFVIYILALISASGASHITSTRTLFLISYLLQPTGILVAFHEFSTGGDERYAILFTAAVMLLQLLATFKKYPKSTLLFIAIFFGLVFFATALNLLDADTDLTGAVLGAALLCLCYAISKTPHRAITPFWYFAGTALITCSSFAILQNSSIEIVYLGLTTFLIYLSTVLRSRVVLIVSALSMLGYIGYFTWENFVDSVGWPLALIMMGFILIGLSSLAIKINKKYISQKS